jgi:hypothetical protein
VTDYGAVQNALAGGAQPAMLCATCPWDRTCITPPTMTRAEIDEQMAKAMKDDERKLAAAEARGQNPGLPAAALLTAITIGSRDTMGQFCPVFALRLRSSGGREIVDTLKASMQKWDDQR